MTCGERRKGTKICAFLYHLHPSFANPVITKTLESSSARQ